VLVFFHEESDFPGGEVEEAEDAFVDFGFGSGEIALKFLPVPSP
jgi:hypothetical protein